jgi:hypothetical protein
MTVIKFCFDRSLSPAVGDLLAERLRLRGCPPKRALRGADDCELLCDDVNFIDGRQGANSTAQVSLSIDRLRDLGEGACRSRS